MLVDRDVHGKSRPTTDSLETPGLAQLDKRHPAGRNRRQRARPGVARHAQSDERRLNRVTRAEDCVPGAACHAARDGTGPSASAPLWQVRPSETRLRARGAKSPRLPPMLKISRKAESFTES